MTQCGTYRACDGEITGAKLSSSEVAIASKLQRRQSRPEMQKAELRAQPT